MAQQHLRQLRDEERRDIHTVAGEETRVGRLERVRRGQPRTKAQPDPVVVAGVRIGQRGDLGVAHGSPRIRQ